MGGDMYTFQSINLEGARFKDPSERPEKKKVLLVEDSPESEALMRHLCHAANANVNVQCVATAEEAQRLLEADSHFDFIIADHFLSGQHTGLDLWKVCNENFRRIPFMMTSSLDMREFVQLTKNNKDFPPYLPKMWSKQTCLRILANFLDSSSRTADVAIGEANINTIKKNTTSFAPPSESVFSLVFLVGLFLIPLVIPLKYTSIQERLPSYLRQETYQKSQPIEIKMEEKLKILPTPHQRKLHLDEILTPDTLEKMKQIVKRADEINRSFDLQ
jgi:CheY-like chemotaxis protein